MRTHLALVAGIGLMTVAHPLVAHHSFAAEFDAAKPFDLTGTVTKVAWSESARLVVRRRDRRSDQEGDELGRGVEQPQCPDAGRLEARHA